MSRLDIEELRNNVLVGYTDKGRRAWHAAVRDSGETLNHFPGAVPYTAAEKLFDWEPIVSYEPQYELETPDGERQIATLDGKKVLTHPKTGEFIAIHSTGRTLNSYKKHVLEFAHEMTGNEVGIATAGCLDNGKFAWIQLEMADRDYGKSVGVPFAPFLAVTDSHCSSYGTFRVKTGSTVIVCENTYAGFFGTNAAEYRKAHRGDGPVVSAAREALGLIEASGERFTEITKRLLDVRVSDSAWEAFLKEHFDATEENPKTRKLETVNELWESSPMVSPWKNTGFGVVQAINTYNHHGQRKGESSRWATNLTRGFTGVTAREDNKVLADMKRLSIIDNDLLASI